MTDDSTTLVTTHISVFTRVSYKFGTLDNLIPRVSFPPASSLAPGGRGIETLVRSCTLEGAFNSLIIG